MNKFIKRTVKLAVALSMMISSINVIPVTAADILYEKKEVQTIAKGLTYEKSRRLYTAGWMDVYVLTVDAKENDLALEVIESINGLGVKETVDKMAKDNDVIAAVNGDFFGSGAKLSSMGQVAGEGQMIAAQNYYNSSENKYAGLFVDNDGLPFIDFVKSSIGFYGPGNISIELGAKNKVTDFSKPVYFDTSVIKDTASLDKTFTKLSKIVVEDGIITSISSQGETVKVPENGYIIAVPSSHIESVLSKFSVGMNVSFAENEKFAFRENKDIASVKVGISGGGELLRNGDNVATGLIIGENARNPRTLLGVNKDKSKVYIVCIDGRKNGIGATHREAADIMKEYGAYDAIHLDGGGSTTMVVQEEGKSSTAVVNVPSEGSLRSVANGIGIKAVGQAGVPNFIKPYIAEEDENYLFKDFASTINIRLYDGTMKEMKPDLSKLQFSSTLAGEWSANKFTPSQEGKGKITVTYGEVSGSMDISVLKGVAALQATADAYALGVGESTNINAVLLNKDGYSLDVDKSRITFSVDNANIGSIENGRFIAKAEGEAIITAMGYDVSSSIKISVGKKHIAINSFEGNRSINMAYYPTDLGITGSSSIASGVSIDGNSSLKIDYGFKPKMTTTQSVYAGFDSKPIVLPANSSDFMLWYKGDGSQYLLKASFKDADGKIADVILAQSLADTNWQQAKVQIPTDLTTPVKLDKIYISSLNTDENSKLTGSIYIDNLVVYAPISMGSGARGNVNDYMNMDVDNLTGSYNTASIFGYSSGITSDKGNTIINEMKKNADVLAFIGQFGVNNASGLPSVTWDNKYNTQDNNNFSFISLGISNGSMTSANKDQWRYLKDYAQSLSKKNVIILMDSYLFTGIKDYRERDAIHDILKTAVREHDKNVIVVSSAGETSFCEVKDGVRYINLAGARGNNLSFLKIRANEKEMYYDIKDIK